MVTEIFEMQKREFCGCFSVTLVFLQCSAASSPALKLLKGVPIVRQASCSCGRNSSSAKLGWCVFMPTVYTKVGCLG